MQGADGGERRRRTLSADQKQRIIAEVAVGTLVSQRPPLRSVRAELPHTAPALGHDAYLGFGCG